MATVGGKVTLILSTNENNAITITLFSLAEFKMVQKLRNFLNHNFKSLSGNMKRSLDAHIDTPGVRSNLRSKGEELVRILNIDKFLGMLIFISTILAQSISQTKGLERFFV